MDDGGRVASLIRHGRRRQVRNLLIHEASFAAALALGGFLLLLLLGTQVLNWYWPVILFAGSLGVGAYRARNKFLSSYRVAQSLDARLNFSDALSTAYFFQQHSHGSGATPEVVEYQSRIAEELARTADVRRGLPFIAPRTFYINAALAVAVLGMFGLRYGINHSLELRSSLVHVSFDGFLGSGRDIAAAKRIRAERPPRKKTAATTQPHPILAKPSRRTSISRRPIPPPIHRSSPTRIIRSLAPIRRGTRAKPPEKTTRPRARIKWISLRRDNLRNPINRARTAERRLRRITPNPEIKATARRIRILRGILARIPA